MWVTLCGPRPAQRPGLHASPGAAARFARLVTPPCQHTSPPAAHPPCLQTELAAEVGAGVQAAFQEHAARLEEELQTGRERGRGSPPSSKPGPTIAWQDLGVPAVGLLGSVLQRTHHMRACTLTQSHEPRSPTCRAQGLGGAAGRSGAWKGAVAAAGGGRCTRRDRRTAHLCQVGRLEDGRLPLGNLQGVGVACMGCEGGGVKGTRPCVLLPCPALPRLSASCLPAVHAFCQACPAPTHPPPPTTRAFARQACVKRGGDYTGGVRGDISFNGDLGEEGRGGVGWFRRAAGTAGRGGWAKQLSTCRGRGGAGSAGRGGRRWRPLLNIHPPMAVPSAVSAPQLVPYWMPLPWSGTTRLRRRSGSTCSEAWGRAGRAAGAGRGLVAAPCAACCRLPACTSPAHGAHALPAAACLPAPPLPMVLTRFHVLRPTNPQGVLWVGTHGPEPGSGAAEGHAAGAGAGQPPRGAPLHAGACIALHLESASTQGTMQLVQGNVQSVCALLRHSWMAAVASGTRTGWQAGRPDSLASTPPAQVAPRSAAPCPTLSTHLLLNVHIPACRRHRRRRVGCARAWRPSSARWERSSGT